MRELSQAALGQASRAASRARQGGDRSTERTPPAAEIQARKANQLRAIRLRIAIYRELDERGSATPAEIGAALGLLPAEATTL